MGEERRKRKRRWNKKLGGRGNVECVIKGRNVKWQSRYENLNGKENGGNENERTMEQKKKK